jgi:transcriptional regulator with XRE-family HTH domain
MHVADSQGASRPGKTALSPSPSPLVQRRRLRVELRRARQEARLTQETVAQEMDWSLSKVIRIETGAVGISTNDLHALLRLYGVRSRQQVSRLVALGREARQQAWWSKYRDFISPAYFQFIEYETAATIIRSHETTYVPGLLQTEDYVKAVAATNSPVLTAKAVQTIIDLRLQRQEQIINQPDPPLTFFSLDEAVIWRLTGEASLARGQLSRLLEIAETPQTTIEVVPFTAGLNRGINESFSILEFEDPGDPDVLYFESARSEIVSRDEGAEITVYRELFEELRVASLGPDGTREFLERILADLA